MKKHIHGTKPGGSRFNQDPSTVKKLIRRTINGGDKLEAGGKYGTQFTKNFKRQIGTDGETTVKVVVKEGRIKTAYPIGGAALGFIGSLLDPFDAISGELGNGELPQDLQYPDDSPCK